MSTILEDIRRYVFPLYLGTGPATIPTGTTIVSPDRNFLGNAFFIARNGVALTADHCIPSEERVPPGQTVLALLWNGSTVAPHEVLASMTFADSDIAIIKVAATPAHYLPISFATLRMGEDVSAVGIPQHSVSGRGKEFRYLKGHVTFSSRFLELSFAAPLGMSRSPVFSGDRVAAVLVGNARSEALEDSIEETITDRDGKTIVKRSEIKAVINYGQAERLSALQNWSHEITEGRPFGEFIAGLNSRGP